MFSQVSVSHSVHWGACIVGAAGQRACTVKAGKVYVARGFAWQSGACVMKGACMVKGGVHGKGDFHSKGVCMTKEIFIARGCAWKRSNAWQGGVHY